MAWICRPLLDWVLTQDFQQWCSRFYTMFVFYNTYQSLSAASGFVRRCKPAGSTKKLVEHMKQLPFIYSVHAVAIMSCYISLLKSSFIDLGNDLLQSGVNALYCLVLDPLCVYFNHPSQPDDRNAHRSYIPRHHGIPGRHNGRRARKKGRIRLPPFRASCVRNGSCVRATTSVEDMQQNKKTRRSETFTSPRRLARAALASSR